MKNIVIKYIIDVLIAYIIFVILFLLSVSMIFLFVLFELIEPNNEIQMVLYFVLALFFLIFVLKNIVNKKDVYYIETEE